MGTEPNGNLCCWLSLCSMNTPHNSTQTIVIDLCIVQCEHTITPSQFSQINYCVLNSNTPSPTYNEFRCNELPTLVHFHRPSPTPTLCLTTIQFPRSSMPNAESEHLYTTLYKSFYSLCRTRNWSVQTHHCYL